MSFTKWLRAQRERDDSIGDLSRDTERVNDWPANVRSYAKAHANLTLHGACKEAFDTLDRAWEEYSGRKPREDEWEEYYIAKADRKKMSPALRMAIFIRDKFTCVICGRDRNDGVKLEVDHIVPVEQGGMTEANNLQTLCFECNRGKGNQ